MSKDKQENRKVYINLIEMIIHNITDVVAIKSIYAFAQSLWHNEKAQDPGG